MEMVFSVGSIPRLYNEDPVPAEDVTGGVFWDGRRRWLRRHGNELVETWKSACKEKILCVM
jgi:hypothetical protein